MRRPSPSTVVVAVLTYRRGEMLRQLLQSFSTLEAPDGWKVRYLIVDNDAEASARSVVDEFRSTFNGSLDYVVEAEPGIPLARNRALDEATQAGARLLCFIDDDEYPAPDWLRQMVSCFETNGAVLMSGPVRALMPDYPTSPWRRYLARGIAGRSLIIERRCAHRGKRGSPIMIATCNWMGDLDWINAKNLRFDPALQFTGGSDTAFFNATIALGGKVEWCEDAVVFEHIPRERLSLRYQFRRARAQGLVHAQLLPANRARVYLEHSLRMLVGVGLMLVPVIGPASLLVGVQLVGRAFGRFAGLRGEKSRLYARQHRSVGIDRPL